MTKQILITLKQKLDDLNERNLNNAEISRNIIKEEIQYYVLDFIYHHSEYSKWIMYGGSALRICHGLNRMSVDLDFEIDQKISKSFLNNLKKEIGNYFFKNYELDETMLTIKIMNGRGLLLRFIIGDELKINHPSKQVHIKIDLNYFVISKTIKERIPVNHDQLSFIIKTYNMSVLMASKIAAVLLRGNRGVGKAVYEEKGRDIYDLLWYMEKKIIPDLDYLLAKNIDISDLRALFDKLTLQMNRVNKENLKQDLSPLFLNQNYINNWLEYWHKSYLRLVESYDIRIVTKLKAINIEEDFRTDNYLFTYLYETDENVIVKIRYNVTFEWIKIQKVLGVKINKDIVNLIKSKTNKELSDQLKQFATLFYQKNKDYFKKTHKIMIGNEITTKTIRSTANNLNQKEQIVLNRSALLSCKLEDLIK